MHSQAELFDHYRDFLSHTLAHANSDLPPISIAQDNGLIAERLTTGILRLTPADDRCRQRKLLLSAGIHGDETAPIELLNALVTRILSKETPLCCDLLVILGNPPAIAQQKRHIDFNLNRLFAGRHRLAAHSAQVESARAARMEQAVNDFMAHQPDNLLHLDLHCAIRPSVYERFALYPFVEGRSLCPQSRQWLEAAGIEAIVLQHRLASTFSAWTAQAFGAESFTLELGRVALFGQNDLVPFAALDAAITRCVALQPAAVGRHGLPATFPTPRAQAQVFAVCHEILRTEEGFELLVPADAPNFTRFNQGDLVWRDDHGSYQVTQGPQYLIFPNPQVPVGQRAGLMLKPLEASPPLAN